MPSLPSERILYPQTSDYVAAGRSSITAAPPPTLQAEPITQERPRPTLRRTTAKINPEATPIKRKSSLKKPDYDTEQSEDTDGPAFHTRKRDHPPPTPRSAQKVSVEVPSPNSQLRRQPARYVKSHKRQSGIYVDPFSVELEQFSSTPTNHSYSTRSRPLRLNADRDNKPVTVTPGRNGKEYIPPVPPLPSKLRQSTKNDDFEWPEEFF